MTSLTLGNLLIGFIVGFFCGNARGRLFERQLRG